MRRRRVVVVGGGISGLATAYHLTHREDAAPGEPPLDVTLLESAPRLGGKILTREIAGLQLDAGPDAILARSAVVERLLTDLGLIPEVSRMARSGAYVWARGALRRLPPSSLFGVPDTPLALLRSRLLSPWGALRAGGDFVLPRRRLSPDPTIAELLRPRFGREVYDLLIEPLLGGVHAGRADVLSARSAVPEVYRAARASRSTYLALRQRRGSGQPRPSGLGMISLHGGLQTLVRALADAIRDVDLRVGTAVTGLEPAGAGMVVTTGRADGIGTDGIGTDGIGTDGIGTDGIGTERIEADAVVLATPAFVSSGLLQPLSPQAAAELAGIPYVGVAIVTMVLRRNAIGRPLDGTGFLVPPASGRMIVGCTWSSVKWEHLVPPVGEDIAVIRCAVGRHGDHRWEGMTDDELVARVLEELAEPMRLSAGPEQVSVDRWPQAMPQYTVGHEHRLVRLATALHQLPAVHLTGAAFRGVGISGCLIQAVDVSNAVLAQLRGTSALPGRATALSGFGSPR